VSTDVADDGEQRLVLAIEANERLRARARAVATLIAAAAAALAATIVLAPATSRPPAASGWGALSVGALILATCAFIAASLVYTGTLFVRKKFIRGLLLVAMFWRVSPHAATKEPSTDDLVDAATKVQHRIAHIMNSAMWIAGLGVVTFSICLGIIAFDQPLRVGVTLAEPVQVLKSCPKFKESFPALITRPDLSGATNYLRLTLAAADCGTTSDVLIFVDRDTTTLESRSGTH
jgi:hypothetical protein